MMSDPDLSEEDLEALDKAWERIRGKTDEEPEGGAVAESEEESKQRR